jgi:hypothetical protein
LADYARVIEARRTGIYRIGPDERTAIDQGIAQADRGEFVADEEVARARKRNGA